MKSLRLFFQDLSTEGAGALMHRLRGLTRGRGRLGSGLGLVGAALALAWIGSAALALAAALAAVGLWLARRWVAQAAAAAPREMTTDPWQGDEGRGR